MSTLRVSSINNAAASAGGIAIDSSGGVSGALPAPNRNLLYNGAMQVAQRGTSTASANSAGGYYTADRWNLETAGPLGVFTQSIENDAPTGSGFRKSLRMLCTTGEASPPAGDLLLISQRMEGQDLQRIAKGTASAQQLTLSFWVKSNVTGTYVALLHDIDNGRAVGSTYTVSASATWERKTITFPADATGVFDNDNARSLDLKFYLGAGTNFTSGTLPATWGSYSDANAAVGQVNLAAATNNYWQITGVQLEVGPVATSFEFKSFGQELRECQRYYYRVTTSANVGISTGWANGTSVCDFYLPLPTMRVAPTSADISNVQIYRPGNATTYTTGTTVLATASSTNVVQFRYTHGTGVFTSGEVLIPFLSTGVLALSSEL